MGESSLTIRTGLQLLSILLSLSQLIDWTTDATEDITRELPVLGEKDGITYYSDYTYDEFSGFRFYTIEEDRAWLGCVQRTFDTRDYIGCNLADTSNFTEPTLLFPGTIGVTKVQVADACATRVSEKFDNLPADDPAKGKPRTYFCNVSKSEFATIGFALLFVGLVLEIVVLVVYILGIRSILTFEGMVKKGAIGGDIVAELIGIISSISLLTTYGAQPSPIMNIVGSIIVFIFNSIEECKGA